MPGPDQPGDKPPDLPQEYAEAYRRGYQRAYEQGAGEAQAEQTTRLDSLDSASKQVKPVAPSDPHARPAHRQPDEDEDIRRKLLAPAVLVGLTLLLLLSAYGLGRVFSSGVSDSEVISEPDGLASSDDGTYDDPDTKKSDAAKPQKRYDGRVDPAAIGGASASCQSERSVDAAGHAVTYEPAHIYDGDTSTAWRCDGSGVGQRFTIELPEETAIGEVGLVPGYAKTDPRSGVDRYAENNRITRVRWLFGDGSSVTQRLDGSADMRDLQTIRIPKAMTDQVVIEILSSTRGPRDTVAISDVRIGAIAG